MYIISDKGFQKSGLLFKLKLLGVPTQKEFPFSELFHMWSP